jgi:hypothetical protein
MTKHYDYSYLPSNENMIYKIIGWYDTGNTNIVSIKGLPSDIAKENIICYNKPSKYVN